MSPSESPAAPAPPAVDTPTTTTQQHRAAFLPPYRVLLHDDDHNEMHHVVRALMASVPGLDEARATEVMLEAHLRGQAEVIRCPLEHAELYRDRLQTFGLTATIEQA